MAKKPPKRRTVAKVLVRFPVPLLRALDKKAADEYMTREAYIRHLASKTTGIKDTRATLSRSLFSPVKPIARK